MHITEAVIIFVSAILSGLLFYMLSWNTHKLKLLLALSGAYLFSITALHLMPEVYAGGDHSIGIFLLLGFFLQLVLDYFSEGIEHGHIHAHAHSEKAAIPFTMLLSLCIHAFFEGMPVGGTHNEHTSDMLVFGIVIHNIPIALALMSLLSQSGISKTKSLILLSIFALMTPLGMMFSAFFNHVQTFDLSNYYQKIMAVVIGIFLHISTTILFESSENHRFNMQKFMVIIAGALLAIATMIFY